MLRSWTLSDEDRRYLEQVRDARTEEIQRVERARMGLSHRAHDARSAARAWGASHLEPDYEYVRHGTGSLLAGLDLTTGEVTGLVRDRHRSREFIEFLQTLDAKYPKNVRIQVILDNHSAHTSKETRPIWPPCPTDSSSSSHRFTVPG